MKTWLGLVIPALSLYDLLLLLNDSQGLSMPLPQSLPRANPDRVSQQNNPSQLLCTMQPSPAKTWNVLQSRATPGQVS